MLLFCVFQTPDRISVIYMNVSFIRIHCAHFQQYN